MFSAVHLEVRELEVSLVAAGVRAHERPLLVAVWRPRYRRGDARDPSNILKRQTVLSHLCPAQCYSKDATIK